MSEELRKEYEKIIPYASDVEDLIINYLQRQQDDIQNVGGTIVQMAYYNLLHFSLKGSHEQTLGTIMRGFCQIADFSENK